MSNSSPSGMAAGDEALLVVLCGLPASGKSTLAKALAHHAESSGVRAVCVHFDDWERARQDADGGFDPVAWKAARGRGMEAARAALQRDQKNNRGSSNVVVVLDDTMHYTSMRLQCWRLARACGSTYCQVHVDCPLALCLERNAMRDKASRIPHEVMERMNSTFEAPTEKHPWDAHTVVVAAAVSTDTDTETDHHEDPVVQFRSVWDDIQRVKLLAPPMATEIELDPMIRKLTTETVAHQVDIQTRRVMAEHIAGFVARGSTEVGSMALKLNSVRRDTLNACKKSLGDGGGDDDSDPEVTIDRWVSAFRAAL